jgi:hypothetical protein
MEPGQPCTGRVAGPLSYDYLHPPSSRWDIANTHSLPGGPGVDDLRCVVTTASGYGLVWLAIVEAIRQLTWPYCRRITDPPTGGSNSTPSCPGQALVHGLQSRSISRARLGVLCSGSERGSAKVSATTVGQARTVERCPSNRSRCCSTMTWTIGGGSFSVNVVSGALVPVRSLAGDVERDAWAPSG